MIMSKEPVSLAEVASMVKHDDDKNVALAVYLKNFNKLTKDKAFKLKEEIEGLNNPKVKKEIVVKIIDFLPKDAIDLQKIFNDSSLTEEEINALLSVISNYRT